MIPYLQNFQPSMIHVAVDSRSCATIFLDHSLQLSILLKSAALGPIRHKIRFDCMIAPSHGVPTTSKTDSNLFKP